MVGFEHYLIGSHREAVTPYVFVGRPLSVQDVMTTFGAPLYGDTTGYYADAEDAGLIKALRSGQVKTAALSGNDRRLLPPTFWKIPGAAFNAFTKGVIDAPQDLDIPGLMPPAWWWMKASTSLPPKITSISTYKLKLPMVMTQSPIWPP